ncbi:MAG: hypothetical protein JNK82_03175 [Myxococcaceae bacterium]|nr:hypothetical protein [Myxococcaceae bacterium]
MRALTCGLVALVLSCGRSHLSEPGAAQSSAPFARECRLVEPGCGSHPVPAPGCYADCQTSADCGGTERCFERDVAACNRPGDVCEACGSAARLCLPRSPCVSMSPGCGAEPLATEGCYAACEVDADCAIDERCASRSVNPCAGQQCNACDAQTRVCVPR